jgi:hypothetical protein
MAKRPPRMELPLSIRYGDSFVYYVRDDGLLRIAK